MNTFLNCDSLNESKLKFWWTNSTFNILQEQASSKAVNNYVFHAKYK